MGDSIDSSLLNTTLQCIYELVDDFPKLLNQVENYLFFAPSLKLSFKKKNDLCNLFRIIFD